MFAIWSNGRADLVQVGIANMPLQFARHFIAIGQMLTTLRCTAVAGHLKKPGEVKYFKLTSCGLIRCRQHRKPQSNRRPVVQQISQGRESAAS